MTLVNRQPYINGICDYISVQYAILRSRLCADGKKDREHTIAPSMIVIDCDRASTFHAHRAETHRAPSQPMLSNLEMGTIPAKHLGRAIGFHQAVLVERYARHEQLAS